MAHKLMPYILPIASIMVIAAIVLLFKPQVTGFFVMQPQLNAEIKITADEILPENAEIHIFLEKNNVVREISSSNINGFINQFPAQEGLKYQYGSNYELGYEGFGYIGSQVFKINLGAEDLKGNYILKTEIIWQGKVISETSQEISI